MLNAHKKKFIEYNKEYYISTYGIKMSSITIQHSSYTMYKLLMFLKLCVHMAQNMLCIVEGRSHFFENYITSIINKKNKNLIDKHFNSLQNY